MRVFIFVIFMLLYPFQFLKCQTIPKTITKESRFGKIDLLEKLP
ncbi:hypothetical protein NT05LI_0196 [Listeria ivanovii FSL F6-596]|nr:hypothetical protein NT05LI_0196 [Listeria ivanovii FSL F6-596]